MYYFLLLLMSFIVYSAPVLIYRWGIKDGSPIANRKKAVLINTAFFAGGIVAIVIFNALMGAYEDDTYHTTFGLVDAIFWGIDYLILTAGKNGGGEKSSNPSNEENTLSSPSHTPKTATKNPMTTDYVRTYPPSDKSESQSFGATGVSSDAYIPIRKVTPSPEPKDITQLYDEYMDSLINPVLSLETGSIAPQNGDTTDWKFELAVLLYMLADCALFGQPNREKESTRLWEYIQLKYNVTLKDREYDFWSRVEIYATLINGQKARCDWMLSDPSAFQEADIPAKLIYAFGDFLITPGCRDDYRNAPIVLHGFDHIVEFSAKFLGTVASIAQAASDFFVICKKT